MTAKRAKHSWKKRGEEEIVPPYEHGVFVRTLTKEEYEDFKKTGWPPIDLRGELPPVGNISAVTDDLFGRMCWRPGLEWVSEKVKERQLAKRAQQIEQELSQQHDGPAGYPIVNEWVHVNGYMVLETAREKLAKELGEKKANALIDRFWIAWAVLYRESERQKTLNRHSRGRRKEDRTQTLVNQLRNPDTQSQQTERMVEALNHSTLKFGHDLRFGHWHPGPFHDQILVGELRAGAVLDAVFGSHNDDDLVVGVLGELYDDGMFHPEVAKEMNAARELEQEAMIRYLEEKPTDELLDWAQYHRARAAKLRRKLGHAARSGPTDDRKPYD